MDCCFVVFETRQHGVANSNDAGFSSFNASANKLHNVTFTISSLVPWTFLPSETRVATPRAPKSKESKSVKMVSRKQDVDDQNQSEHKKHIK